MCGTTCQEVCCKESEKDSKIPGGIVKLKSAEDNAKVHTYVSLELL
jgi:hypothetical protein